MTHRRIRCDPCRISVSLISKPAESPNSMHKCCSHSPEAEARLAIVKPGVIGKQGEGTKERARLERVRFHWPVDASLCSIMRCLRAPYRDGRNIFTSAAAGCCKEVGEESRKLLHSYSSEWRPEIFMWKARPGVGETETGAPRRNKTK